MESELKIEIRKKMRKWMGRNVADYRKYNPKIIIEDDGTFLILNIHGSLQILLFKIENGEIIERSHLSVHQEWVNVSLKSKPWDWLNVRLDRPELEFKRLDMRK